MALGGCPRIILSRHGGADGALRIWVHGCHDHSLVLEVSCRSEVVDDRQFDLLVGVDSEPDRGLGHARQFFILALYLMGGGKRAICLWRLYLSNFEVALGDHASILGDYERVIFAPDHGYVFVGEDGHLLEVDVFVAIGRRSEHSIFIGYL